MIHQRSRWTLGVGRRRPPLRVLAAFAGAGALAVTTVSVATLGVSAAAASGPSITAPSSGTAGTSASFGAANWPALERVDFYLQQGSTQTYFCSLSSDSTGTLSPGELHVARRNGREVHRHCQRRNARGQWTHQRVHHDAGHHRDEHERLLRHHLGCG